MSNPDNVRLFTRAVAALFRSDPNPDTPLPGRSDVEEHDGLRYVVLRSDQRLLAVYRLRNDGQLKRIRRRLPTALVGERTAA